MPTYSKFRKEILSGNREVGVVETTKLPKQCSALFQSNVIERVDQNESLGKCFELDKGNEPLVGRRGCVEEKDKRVSWDE